MGRARPTSPPPVIGIARTRCRPGTLTGTTAAELSALPEGTRCARDQTGDQWVTGGATNINMTGTGANGGVLELCGSASQATGSKQQIAMYGLKSGANGAGGLVAGGVRST